MAGLWNDGESMTKLIVFIIIVSGLIWIKGMSTFHGPSHGNEKFNYDSEKEAHISYQKELEAIRKSHEETEEKVEVKKVEFTMNLDTPELQRGSKLFSKCIVCHNKLGEGRKSQNAPKVGGQFDWYVETQITNMQKGVRVNKVMEPYVKNLSGQDIKDLAAYISKLPWKRN